MVLMMTMSAIILGIVGPYIFTPAEPDGLVLGWDLAQFVAAGRLVADGRGAAMYDQAVQYTERLALVGPERKIAFPPGNAFISPPALAVAYAPFAAIPFPVAEFLHRWSSFGAFAWAMYLVRKWLPVPWPFAAVLGLASPWSLTNVQTGQTTYVAALLWAAAARLVEARRLNAAAAVLGIGLIKPQLVWPGLALVALRGGWLGAAAAGGALYAVSLAVTGDVLWPRTWLTSATTVAAGEPGGLMYDWQNYFIAASASALWLCGPSGWRGRTTLLLPAASLALVPYPFHYYYLLGVLPFWVGAASALQALKCTIAHARPLVERPWWRPAHPRPTAVANTATREQPG
jgi:hypothetical protein